MKMNEMKMNGMSSFTANGKSLDRGQAGSNGDSAATDTNVSRGGAA
jgi:hypothetical protein